MGRVLSELQKHPPEMPTDKWLDLQSDQVTLPTHNLGEQQKDLLSWFADWILAYAPADKSITEVLVPYHNKGFTRSECASLSRALRRLDDRGYLFRVRSGHRTIGVILTGAGMDAAVKISREC